MPSSATCQFSTLGVGWFSQAGISKHYLNLGLHLTAKYPHSPFTDGQTELHPGRRTTKGAKEMKSTLRAPLPITPAVNSLLLSQNESDVNFSVSILDFAQPFVCTLFKQSLRVSQSLGCLLNDEE